MTSVARAKRRLFPSTLLESSWRAQKEFDYRKIRDLAGLRDQWVLHSTYLAPVARHLVRDGNQVVVDVYDLVWRSHAIDGERGSITGRLVRRAYSNLARRKEERALREVQRVLVAGYGDWERLRSITNAHWVPTGVPLPSRGLRPTSSPKLRVGLIGNFAHHPTASAAAALAASPLARSPDVEIIFAGPGSEFQEGEFAHALGFIDDVSSFYDAVDCVVVPVSAGTGIKVKLLEGMLHGKPVFTTPHGADGLDPGLRQVVHVFDDIAGVRPEAVATVCATHDSATVAVDAATRVGWGTSVCRYRENLAAASEEAGRRRVDATVLMSTHSRT